MVDFRVDDGLPWHPKTVGISPPTLGVWTLAGCWCAHYLTDGYIPGEVLRGLGGKHTTAAVQELLNRNMFIPLGDGYQFVDWLQYQRSKEDVKTEREQWRIRQQRARRKRWGPPDVTP